MTYRIEQSEAYAGNDYWNWSAWIEGDDSDLDRITKVAWLLHPTFKESRITIEDRESKFRLVSSGWGQFLLRAEVFVREQTEPRVLSHLLSLRYPNGQGTVDVSIDTRGAGVSEGSGSLEGAPSARPKLYLSYASEDAGHARELRAKIEHMGADVLDATTIAPGVPLRAGMRKLIRESDAVIGLFGSTYASPWVLEELTLAKSEEKPVVTLSQEKLSGPQAIASTVGHIGLDDNTTTALLSEFVGKLTAR